MTEARALRRRTGADLRAALEALPALDDRFEADVAEALACVDSRLGDPWAEAGAQPPRKPALRAFR